MFTELYDYQEETASDIFRRMKTKEIRGAYLGFDTGVGKTVTSLSVAERLHNEGLIDGVVVVCPVSKLDDWEEDLNKEVPEILKSRTYVTSFQSSWREKALKEVEKIFKTTQVLLIIDEGHKMKTYDSKQSKYLQKIAGENMEYVLILSATSQNKKYIDMYPQYKALGNPVFNIPVREFKKRYCLEALNFNLVRAGKARVPFNEIVGYQNTDELDKAILDYTYYKKYESDYERPIEIFQKLKMTSDMRYFKDKKVWPKMDEKALSELLLTGGDIEDVEDYIIANRPTLFHIYSRESCSGFIKDFTFDKNPKLQWVEDFLEGNEGRVVIFTNFIHETVLLGDLCTKLKRSWMIYDGAAKDLTEWHEKEDCIAIVNIQAGGSGINDFVKTNIGIYFSPPENYIDFTQSKGRLDRIGQTKQPVFYYLQIAGSVEPEIYNALKLSKNFDQRLFNSWSGMKEEEKTDGA